jgi:hypothetical protein
MPGRELDETCLSTFCTWIGEHLWLQTARQISVLSVELRYEILVATKQGISNQVGIVDRRIRTAERCSIRWELPKETSQTYSTKAISCSQKRPLKITSLQNVTMVDIEGVHKRLCNHISAQKNCALVQFPGAK